MATRKRKGGKITNKTRRNIEFKVGQIVMAKNFEISEYNALNSKWEGPYEIINIADNQRNCTLQDITDNTLRISHSMHLKHFKGTGENSVVPTKFESMHFFILNFFCSYIWTKIFY